MTDHDTEQPAASTVMKDTEWIEQVDKHEDEKCQRTGVRWNVENITEDVQQQVYTPNDSKKTSHLKTHNDTSYRPHRHHLKTHTHTDTSYTTQTDHTHTTYRPDRHTLTTYRPHTRTHHQTCRLVFLCDTNKNCVSQN